jgi:methylated-DNA-[protein]-cysteine S-methyltransferase
VLLAPRGTAFQESVWQHIASIGSGQLLSYGEIATQLGSPSASRAVDAASDKNPISLFIPFYLGLANCARLVRQLLAKRPI